MRWAVLSLPDFQLAVADCRAGLRGAVVVLVDDVRTTGATLHACAEVLVGLNVAEVRVLTAAVRTHDRRGYSSSGSTAP